MLIKSEVKHYVSLKAAGTVDRTLSVRRSVLGRLFLLATDWESSVAELCPCALNDGSSRCCRAQATSTRVTIVEGDEFQKVLRTTTSKRRAGSDNYCMHSIQV